MSFEINSKGVCLAEVCINSWETLHSTESRPANAVEVSYTDSGKQLAKTFNVISKDEDRTHQRLGKQRSEVPFGPRYYSLADALLAAEIFAIKMRKANKEYFVPKCFQNDFKSLTIIPKKRTNHVNCGGTILHENTADSRDLTALTVLDQVKSKVGHDQLCAQPQKKRASSTARAGTTTTAKATEMPENIFTIKTYCRVDGFTDLSRFYLSAKAK